MESDGRMRVQCLKAFAPQFGIFGYMEHANDMRTVSGYELVSVCER